MKKLAVLFITAVLGSVAFAAGTNMAQDEPGLDSRPAGNEPASRRPLQQGVPFLRDRGPDGPPQEGRRPNGRNPQGPSDLDIGDFDRAREYEGPLERFNSLPMTDSSGDRRYMRSRIVTRPVFEERFEPISKEEIAEMNKLEEATRLLHSSKDEAGRQKATETIREQLNAQFDRDLKRREKELADIEARLKTLRDQVEKRKAARDRIVGLKLDTIINEADGLGFPGESARPVESDLFGVRYRSPGFLEPARVDDLADPNLLSPPTIHDHGVPPASNEDPVPVDKRRVHDRPLVEEEPVEIVTPAEVADDVAPN